MGRYTGTSHADTITPTTVSAGVTADPPGSKPSDAADQIHGMGGGDTLSGGGGDDGVLASGAGNTIHGDARDDYIGIGFTDTGGANPVTNTAWGDAGNDTIEFNYHAQSSSDSWVGQHPTGTITLHGGAGDDALGNSDSNTDYGDYGIYLDGTTAVLYGEAGNDGLYASHSSRTSGGLEPGHNPDILHGGTGDDDYVVFETKDVAVEKPGEGYDMVDAIATDYTLGPNIEMLRMESNDSNGPLGHHGTGNALNNVIVGTGLNETLDGAGGNDTIYGSHYLLDYADEDTIHGGTGNDLIYGAWGREDDISDGADQLYGDAGNDRIFGQFGDDVLYGGPGNDSLAGQAGNDTLWGGTGNDHLGGGTGDDALYGEYGVDAITGRYGADTLSGGAGNDRFVYEDITDSKPGAGNHDTILDMAGIGGGGGDRIDLAQIDADATKAGDQAFTFVASTAVLKAGQLHVVAGGGSDSLVQGEVDGKAGIDFEILVHDGATKPVDWAASDFIL